MTNFLFNNAKFLFAFVLLLCANESSSYAQSWERVDIGMDCTISNVHYQSEDDRFLVLAFTGSKYQPTWYIFSGTNTATTWTNRRIPAVGFEEWTMIRAIWGLSVDSVILATILGPLITTNGGANWSFKTQGLPNNITTNITVCPSHGTIIGTASGPYYNRSWTGAWTLLDPEQSNNSVYDVYSNGSFIAISAFEKFSFSTNSGSSWIYENVPEDFYYGIAYHKSTNTIFYCSNDSLVRFELESGKKYSHYFGWGVDPHLSVIADNYLYLFGFSILSPQYRVFVYDIIGATMSELDLTVIFQTTSSFSHFAVDKRHIVYLGTDSGLYRSTEPIVTTTPEIAKPGDFSLSSSYPNPASSGTPVTLRYTLERASQLTLVVRDVLGRIVSEQSLGTRAPGKHTHAINTTGLPPGLYFYTLLPSSGAALSGKMVVR